MISHDSAFEALAVAPVKQSDVIVASQIQDTYGLIDGSTVWSASDVLMEVKIDAVGQMLGTVTKKATVRLMGIVSGIKNKDIFQIRLGLYNSDPSVAGYDYISQGIFYVDTVDYDYDSGSTTVVMYDAMWTAGKDNYSETIGSNLITYPVSVAGYASYIASILGVDLMSGFSSLPNASYMITEDLYALISTATIQNVIQDIAGATGTTARMTNNTLTFSQYTPTSENLDSDSLKTLKIGNTYGPVTSVVLGRVPQNDNIAIAANNPQNYVVESVNTTTEALQITQHAMADGNLIQLTSTGSLPSPLLSNVSYYVKVVDANNFKLAPTYSDAIANTNIINLTSAGSGTISIVNLPTREIQINNNQILDDSRATLVPSLYNKLSGIYWTDIKSDTMGLGWHEVGDVINFTQGSLTVRAFLSEVHLVLAGSVQEQLVSFVPDVANIDYQAAGGIQASIYNTELKVDKQAQTITSLVSRQDTIEGEVNTNFSSITQSVDDVLLTIQKSGGGNLLLNSVGYATITTNDSAAVSYPALGSWTYQTGYTVAGNGAVTTFDSTESQNYGGISGHVIQMSSANYLGTPPPPVTITQRVNVAVGVPLCFGVRVKAPLSKGDAVITLTNTTDSHTITIDDASNYNWQELSLENFTSSMTWLDITITSTAQAFQFTDLRLLYGATLQGWVQSNAEILSANVQFNKDGMRIFDSSHNTETRVTYNDFSTRRKSDGVVLFSADDTGVYTNDLNIKGSTNYYSPAGNITIRQITIDPSNTRGGVAFIKKLN